MCCWYSPMPTEKISVGTELEDLQAMVGGDIEVTYPFEDEVAIILNESGKINGLPLNRAIYTEDGDMQDIYAGDFLVVGLTEDDFGSLTSEQMQKFEEQFHQPQMFVRMGRSIMAIPVPDDMVKKMEEKAAKSQERANRHRTGIVCKEGGGYSCRKKLKIVQSIWQSAPRN